VACESGCVRVHARSLSTAFKGGDSACSPSSSDFDPRYLIAAAALHRRDRVIFISEQHRLSARALQLDRLLLMQIVSLHADARADERQRARPDRFERRLARFQPRFRSRVQALAARHPRLKDLVLSFPALLFALAVPRPGYDRERVCARVIDGAPLRELSQLTKRLCGSGVFRRKRLAVPFRRCRAMRLRAVRS
jgi:hypothetical protein